MARRPHGTGRIYARGRIWWIKYYRAGQPIFETTKSEKRSDAERLLRIRLGDESAGRATATGKVTISQICKLVVADYEITKKRSLSDVVYRINKHIDPMVGSKEAKSVGSETFKSYISQRRKAGAEDSTINRELSIIRRGFTLAMRERPPLLVTSPHIPKLEEDNVREGFLEDADYRKVLECMPGQLKALFVCAYHVGMRLGELRKLEWSWVDMEAGEIRIPRKNAKSKKPRTVPIYGDMVEALESQKSTRDEKWPACQWVFHYMGRPIGATPKGWKKAVVKAGFPALLRHDLRRSAIRNMERAGINRKMAMEISGHRTEAVFRRYDIVSTSDLASTKAKMTEFFREARGNKSPKITPEQSQNGDN